MAVQIPLSFPVREHTRLSGFTAGANDPCLNYLRELTAGKGEVISYLWGGAGAGKTHLLQALCREMRDQGQAVALLPCADAAQWQPAIFDAMENYDLLCLDDVHCLAGLPQWEEALFHLINRGREHRSHRLVLTADAPLQALPLGLPDLASRLAWGMVFQVHSLDDAGKAQVLRARARSKGFDLGDDVVQYLFRYFARDMHSMCALLERIDYASLAAQRRITLAFVRQILGQDGPI